MLVYSQATNSLLQYHTITEKTSTGTLVQAHQAQVLHDPKRRATRGTLDRFCNLTLDLQANLDNLKRVCEDLTRE